MTAPDRRAIAWFYRAYVLALVLALWGCLS